jgi:general secretion pathway protein D
VEVLSAEGYAASTSVGAGTPILILPIPPINSVIIFSSSETVMNHALQWSKELDKPSESQAGGAFFTYPVKYADAQALAKTLSELIGGSTSSTCRQLPEPGRMRQLQRRRHQEIAAALKLLSTMRLTA